VGRLEARSAPAQRFLTTRAAMCDTFYGQRRLVSNFPSFGVSAETHLARNLGVA
jgi:hypothetical protein